ncbi:MAG: GntR family transcriptional regulator [Betaproteobacteria bacterium]
MPAEARVVPLSRDSPVAMHRQLAQRLRDAIARGVYKDGARIPTEPHLTRRYGVSRITARQAVDALAREGLVVRQQGKGTFVSGPVVHHDLLELRGVYDQLVAHGLNPQTSLLEWGDGVPPAPVARRLGSGRRKLQRWDRLYRLGGKPFALSRVHLNGGAARVAREQVEANPTYSILEKLLRLRIGRAEVSIRYVRAPADIATALRLRAGAPLMVLERVSYGATGLALEHSRYYARAESYEFSLTVRGKLSITRSLKTSG